MSTLKLRFGVVADPHITTPESAKTFERALRYCKRRNVDAVMVPGDITDWGLVSGFKYAEAAWRNVFGGTNVSKLFITGNHDYDGWLYGDMTMEMHANGYSEDEAATKKGIEKVWKSAFGTKFVPIRTYDVKGYHFLAVQWRCGKDLNEWLAKNGKQLMGEKPFFYFQHSPIAETTVDGPLTEEGDIVHNALKDYPNAIAFTAHTHLPFNDDRCIWQGDFTAISSPSLSYNGFWGEFENFGGRRDGSCTKAMPWVPARMDLRGGQGFIVNVYSDRIVVERVDIEENGEQDSPPWVLPWPISSGKPYAPETYSKAYPAPHFPPRAKLKVDTRNANDRQGKWAIALNCEFPSATAPNGTRVFDYEIQAVPLDGSEPTVKCFVNPALHKLARYESDKQRFWFNTAELPQDKDYVVKVYPRDCWGKRGKPLVSPIRHTAPGLDVAKRD